MYNNSGNEQAYVGMVLPISNAQVNDTGQMLCERVKYTAQIGRAVLSTANTNLDGTGTTETLISGTNYGTLVKRIIIKAQGTTTQGMVRIFHYSGANVRLMNEIPVPAITQSAMDVTLIHIIDDFFYLAEDFSLKVSTEKSETFIVTAEGMDMDYPA